MNALPRRIGTARAGIQKFDALQLKIAQHNAPHFFARREGVSTLDTLPGEDAKRAAERMLVDCGCPTVPAQCLDLESLPVIEGQCWLAEALIRATLFRERSAGKDPPD